MSTRRARRTFLWCLKKARYSPTPFAHLKRVRATIVMNDEASAESDPETIAFSNVHWVCSRKTTTAAAFATIESASTWSSCVREYIV